MRKTYDNRLKQAREEVGLTQVEVVKRLGLEHQSLISQQEAGFIRPNLYDAVKLSELYDVPIEKLFHGYFEEEDKKRNK